MDSLNHFPLEACSVLIDASLGGLLSSNSRNTSLHSILPRKHRSIQGHHHLDPADARSLAVAWL